MNRANMTIRGIVFDFGNVLVHWEPFLALSEDFVDEEAMKDCLCQIDFYSWNLEQDRGRPWGEGLTSARHNHPEHVYIFESYHRNLAKTVSRPVEGMSDVLQQLYVDGFALYGLTNAPFGVAESVRQTVPELALMKEIVVSAEEGVIKPDPAIYQTLIKRTGMQPHELLFIDDKFENVEAAKKCGLSAIQFTSANLLMKQLKQMNKISK